MMVGILGFAGLAIDVGQLRLTKQQLQATADAAALSAAMAINTCGSTPNCAAMQTAAKSALVENGITTSTFQQNCAAVGGGTVLTLNNGPCAMGSVANDPNYGNPAYVEAIVSKAQPTYFAAVLGITSMNLSARAEAGIRSPSPCIYALDPTGAAALNVSLLAGVYSPKCGIVVESSSADALNCAVLASITASQIQVVGGYVDLLCSITPTPVTIKLPNPPDPLAYLPTPAIGACGSTTASPYFGARNQVSVGLLQTAVLNPGTYCGGINIGLGATVTFNPGTYVLGSSHGPGGLIIYCGATVAGSGVTFYNYGPSGSVTFLASSLLGDVNLSAPTSGTYSGVLFFQDPGNTSAATILGTTSWDTVLQGAYYFPQAQVSIAIDGFSAYNLLVAKDILFLALTDGVIPVQTGANNSNDFSSLASGSPLQKTIPVLVQ
jgi:hypothetical protein